MNMAMPITARAPTAAAAMTTTLSGEAEAPAGPADVDVDCVLPLPALLLSLLLFEDSEDGEVVPSVDGVRPLVLLPAVIVFVVPAELPLAAKPRM